jgi:isoleucyl-tRNA synthetase
LIDRDLESAMEVVREVVRLGRNLRKREGLRVRQPLMRLTVLTRDSAVARAVDTHSDVIADEMNVKEVATSPDEGALVHLSAKANFRTLGPLFGAKMPEAASAISALKPEEIEAVLDGGTVSIAGRDLDLAGIFIERTPRDGTVVEAGAVFAVALDTTVSNELLLEGISRELISRIQRLRREAGLDVTDRVVLVWRSQDPLIRSALSTHAGEIGAEVLAVSIEETVDDEGESFDIDRRTVSLLVRPA